MARMPTLPTFDEFQRDALAVEGEMWLDDRHLMQGGTFQLARGTPHAERYGPAGAVYWMARRN